MKEKEMTTSEETLTPSEPLKEKESRIELVASWCSVAAVIAFFIPNIISLLAIPLSIISIVCGMMARKRNPKSVGGLISIVAGIVVLVLTAGIFLLFIVIG